MVMTLKDEAPAFEICPAGPCYARCVRLIDMGTQKTVFNGEEKLQRKYLITWATDHLTSNGEPAFISHRYTWSFDSRSNLRADLVSWRGRQFTEDELKSFNIQNVLGAYCVLNVVHQDGSDNKTWARVNSVTPIMKGTQLPVIDVPFTVFDLDNFDQAVFEGLTESVKKTIMQSPEYEAAIEYLKVKASPEYIEPPVLGAPAMQQAVLDVTPAQVIVEAPF